MGKEYTSFKDTQDRVQKEQQEIKELLICEMKRAINIMESHDKTNVMNSSELKSKLKEIRRDSIRLEKTIY